MPAIGLVTVLFQSDAVLPGFVKSIYLQDFKDYQLYIIDNQHNTFTDQLLDRLFQEYPIKNVTLIPNPGNAGVAKANNQGIQAALAAGCTHVLLLNNDIEIEKQDLLSQLYHQAIVSGESLIVPKILYYDNRRICMAGGIFYQKSAVTEHIGAGQPDQASYNQPSYINYAPTTFMLIHKGVFQQIGLMDEKYFVYYDDTDFVYRAGKSDYQVYYMPQIAILHKESSATGGNNSLFFVYYIHRNRLYFIKKHYQGYAFLRAVALFGLDVLRLLRAYNNKQRKTLIKALAAGLFMKVSKKEHNICGTPP